MISVVIPLYNKAHTIVRTINTVLNQTFQDFEIIIVDDGSTDNGVEAIFDSFEDKRLVIIKQPNCGVSAARNTGVKAARGEWIALLDADDEWHPDYLSVMSEQIRKYPDTGLFSSGGLVQDPQGLHYRLSNKYLNYIGKVDFFENPFVFIHTSSTIINNSVFKKTDGFPVGMKCLEDFALFVQMAFISDFVYVGIPLSKYNGGVAGQTTSVDEETRYQWLQFVVLFYNLFYKKWIESGCKSKTARIFLLYDLRHRFKGYLNAHNWRSLDYLYSNLNPEMLNLLTCCDRILCKKHMSFLGKTWINLTKLLWRTHKFPIVGEKADISKIKLKYRRW